VILDLDPTDTEKGGVLDSWGRWLDTGWTWDWFATLTFDQSKAEGIGHDVIGWGLSARYWDEWVGKLTEQTGMPGLYWVRGREPNPANRGTHFHALIGGAEHLSRREAWGDWKSRHGFARILPYGRDEVGRPVEGAARYISKYVVKELGDITFSPNLGLMKRYGADDSDRAERTHGGTVPDGWRLG
jgi:hypothetical protein